MIINRQVFPIDADVAVAPQWTMDGAQFVGQLLQVLFVPESADTVDSGASLRIDLVVDRGTPGFALPVFAADSILGAPLFLHQPGQQGELPKPPVATPQPADKHTRAPAPEHEHDKDGKHAKDAKPARAGYGTAAAPPTTPPPAAEAKAMPPPVIKELGMAIYSANEGLRVTVKPGAKVKGSLYVWVGASD
jgi:hypothetical protein